TLGHPGSAWFARDELAADDAAAGDSGDEGPSEDPEVHDHHAERLRHVGQETKRQRRAEARARTRELGHEGGDRRRDRGGHHLLAGPLSNKQKPEPEEGYPPGKPRDDVVHAARIPAW